ncbi:uncharacterized protein BP5553_10186 [Venustampulla echinocandica]|uniref:AAA+ ATPase domain-containing protein n=1 Tax=Venustampulla echinocandica TaxID=2656787 RepID=A0A370TAN3_9HELO|nr:uncharacterized protein BP5553_10186 [Venustampulla echinocandica]RDL30841.1 hypothetical protein BP5553_10186 [Venustampulla echinocandica]
MSSLRSSKRKSESVDKEKETGNMLWKKTRTNTPVAVAAATAKADALLTPDSTLDANIEEAAVAVNHKDPDFGTSTAIKTFYEGRNSCGSSINWVETPPKQLAEKKAKANTRVAIKIFKVKDHGQPTISGRTPLKIHMVELQSRVLVTALKPILKDAGMFVESTEPAKFSEPFKPLFFSYDKIMDLNARTKKDGPLKQHLDLLIQIMEELFGGFMTHLKNLKASGLISYKLAWTYLPKGTMLYCPSKDSDRVCRVVRTAYATGQCNYLEIAAEEIAFDGETFAWTPIDRQIPLFEGNLPITVLPVYPLSFHENPEDIIERLSRRAKKTIEYQELTYCEYTGVALQQIQQGFARHNVTGRILIDYVGYKKHKDGVQKTSNNANRSRGNVTSTKEATLLQSLDKETQEENKEEMLNREEDLPYVSPLLKGYALKNKEWLFFYVNDIKSMVWNDDAYGHLVYPEEQKDLVLTFVDNHLRLKTRVDDVIMGKGQGLIMLLSGPPGTGKTLTAEAVADKTRRPLYYLQAEDLGTDAAHLGSKIKKVFEMATEWDAVILLDEADVFMAERDPGDIARNELVSIFLRELEYFRGIIFLTTNLYSTIDTAFRSRVHLHLVFSPLPFSSRLILWQKFLSRLDVPVVLGPQEMQEVAKWELNGREIKNVIKTARIWCVCKKFEMNLLRLESAIKVTAPQATKAEVMANGKA